MIVELLHKVAGMELEEHQYRPRPSMAGPDRCIRQMVYQRLGVTPDRELPDRLKHIFDDGNWHEELTKEWISKTAFTLHSSQMGVTLPYVFDWLPRTIYPCSICEQQVCPADLHGHIDGIVTDILNVDRHWEHKGLNHFTFEKLWARKEYPEDYFCQCAIYVKALQRENPDIMESLLVVKNKNTSGFLEYAMSYDTEKDCLRVYQMTLHDGQTIELNEIREHIVQQALAKFAIVEAEAIQNHLPARPYEYDDWHCTYCRYPETCWQSYAEELKSITKEAELEPEWADRVRYYQELAAHVGEQDKERKALGAEILAYLKEHGIKKGRAGEYVVSLIAQNKQSIDWDLVPASLQASLDYYKRSKPVAFIRATKLKGN